MLAIIFALIALVGWGVGDIFTTFATRKIGSYNASFYGYVFGTLISSLYIPFAINTLINFKLEMIVLTLILSVFQIVAFIAYNEALRIGNSSLVGTIAGAFTSLVVILSLIFLGEKLSSEQLISIIIIFVGLFLSSLNFLDLKLKKTFINKGTLFALLAMIGWAIYFTFIKIPVQESGFFWPTYLSTISGVIILLILGFRKIKKPKLGLHSGFPAVFISGVLLTIGSFGFNIGISQGLSSVVAPIAGAYPALYALLAFYIFKDPINKQQKLGMVVALVGIILLAYLSR